jgi:hypothetical protein
MSLIDKLAAPQGAVFLYGTTPPREGSAEDAVRSAAEKLHRRIERLPFDGMVVYDLQDESARIAAPRPFPFARTIDPRDYSALLGSLTGRPTITYKCIGQADEAEWRTWLEETQRMRELELFTIVGRPSSQGAGHALSLFRAVELAREHPRRFALGGVAIAEREDAAHRESHRMVEKMKSGCRFFISQAVYAAAPTLRLLADYARECTLAGLEPRRVLLTFTPCGREKTMAFIKWLGIEVSEATERAIFSAANPLARSIEIARENLQRILDEEALAALPLGINVESVSINKDEIDASVDLFHALREVLASSGRAG